MATFEELMEQFRNPGETGVPETFADDLARVYAEDLSVRDAAVKDRENRIAEKDKAIADAELEMVRLKARNYDLLSAAPKPADADNEPEPDTKKVSGIDSLFED
jgi:hypothetical protein